MKLAEVVASGYPALETVTVAEYGPEGWPAEFQVYGLPEPVATGLLMALNTVQLTVSGALPVTLLAVKVTGWQARGGRGEMLPEPTAGAGASTVTDLISLSGCDDALVTWSETVLTPAEVKVVCTELVLPEDGAPSGELPRNWFGAPVDVLVKVTGSPVYIVDGFQVKLATGGPELPVYSWTSKRVAAER